MSFRKLVLIAASILAIASCKDEEETESIPSISGVLSFTVPPYVGQNEIVTMTPTGASHPDGGKLGYYWKVTPDMEVADTTRLESGFSPEGEESDGSFTYKFRDSLGTYTISCYAFAKGYSNTYATANATVVKGGLDGSLTGTGIKATDANIKAGDITYYYVSHNGLDWMRTNLANPESGAPYTNSEAMGDIFGRYYSHTEAREACPEGWRLPYDSDWAGLAASVTGKEAAAAYAAITGVAADFMADVTFVGKTMWEYWPEVGEITNKAQIAVIPAGYANLGEKAEEGGYPMATFTGVAEYAAFWTADVVEDEDDAVEDEAGMAYYRYIYCDQPDMFVGKGDVNTLGLSVRCVRPSL